MGIGKKPVKFSRNQIGHLAQGLDDFVGFLEALSGNCGLLRDGLRELSRYRESAAEHRKALDYETFLIHLRQKNGPLAELLESAELKRFDVGRLDLSFDDSIAKVQAELAKAEISSELSEVYGADFRVQLQAA
jgi:hypothetical protein